jgi:hypothetical protein
MFGASIDVRIDLAVEKAHSVTVKEVTKVQRFDLG